jgi:dolichyl-phosphate beta-glucosyltransferase
MARASQRDDRATVTVVVPMFNEEERVAESFAPLLEFVGDLPAGSRLLFVDDGSSDRTTEVIRTAMAKSKTHLVDVVELDHAGKGAALRAGLVGLETDLAAFCDVDLATPLDQVAILIAAAARLDGLVVGSRASTDADIKQHESLKREIAGRAFNGLVRMTLCPGIADTQCGAKAAPTATWDAILSRSREDGFAWDVEIIAIARRLSIPVEEIGVRWEHDERSRVRVGRDGAAMVLAVPRIWRNVRRRVPVLLRSPAIDKRTPDPTTISRT